MDRRRSLDRAGAVDVGRRAALDADARVTKTVIRTVGAKGYDGLAVILVEETRT
ncbi:MAG: hypothetical protein AB1635_18850 [Acidobacteriota bacterium]